MKFWIALVVSALLARSAVAQIQIMPADKEQRLRSYIPKLDDHRNIVAKLAEATLYTDEEMPPMHQHQPLAGGRGASFTTFMSVYQQLNGSPLPTNMNREFPWGDPGGLHLVDKSRRYEFKALWLPPKDEASVWPIVVYKGPLERSTRVNMPSPMGWRWIFPRGTILTEVLLKNFSDGTWACYEVRMRLRDIDAWDHERYTPDLELPAFTRVARQRMVDTQHPRIRAFDQTAVTRELPPIPDARAKLLAAIFKPAIGLETPTANDHDNVVPKDYAGQFLNDCNDCHRDTLRVADRFQEREWYDYERGSDGIFSVRPLTANGQLRPDMAAAGMVEIYDPAKHPTNVYQVIDEFHNGPRPNAEITNSIVVGG